MFTMARAFLLRKSFDGGPYKLEWAYSSKPKKIDAEQRMFLYFDDDDDSGISIIIYDFVYQLLAVGDRFLV